MTIEQTDLELIKAAQDTIKRLYKDGKHHIGAAVRTKTGKIYSAVHLEAYIGRVSVCAEAIVLGKAISEGESEFETIVAVRHPDQDEINQNIEVVSPCGICRELISDYGTEIQVILKVGEEHIKKNIRGLLPDKYKRTE